MTSVANPVICFESAYSMLISGVWQILGIMGIMGLEKALKQEFAQKQMISQHNSN